MSFVSELHLGEDGLDGVEVGGVGGVEDDSDVQLMEGIHDIVGLVGGEVVEEDGNLGSLVQLPQLPDVCHHAGSVEGPVLDHDMLYSAVAIDTGQGCVVGPVDGLLIEADVGALVGIGQSGIGSLGEGSLINVDYFDILVICSLQFLTSCYRHLHTDRLTVVGTLLSQPDQLLADAILPV